MSFLDSLYIRRFGLPSTFDVDTNENKPDCYCGNYHHIACIFIGRGENLPSGKKIHILSYGMNQYKDVECKHPSIHAEYNAITKLAPLEKKHRKGRNLYKCNIFVTRVSKTNKLGISKPCYQCIHNMNTLPETKGYRIKNVYYTDRDSNIVRRSLDYLLHEDTLYYTRHQRKH